MNEKERKVIHRWVEMIMDSSTLEEKKRVRFREKADDWFCKNFTVNIRKNPHYIQQLLSDAILEENVDDVEVLFLLAECFGLEGYIVDLIAPLLIQPWHSFHDSFARVVSFNANPKFTDLLFRGAVYTCDNLEYQEDYKEFNRKCMFGLLKIGTQEALDKLYQLTLHEDKVISDIATYVLKSNI